MHFELCYIRKNTKQTFHKLKLRHADSILQDKSTSFESHLKYHQFNNPKEFTC